MGMAKSYSELERMSRNELIIEYDNLAQTTVVGTNYYLEAIRHKSLEEYSTRMDQMTRRIYLLTFVVTLATLVNLVLFAVSVYS